MRRYPAVVLRRATVDTQRPRTELCQSAKREFWPECHRRTDTLLSKRSVCYDYQSCGEVSERLKELASKASVGGTLPWVQIPPSPPYLDPCVGPLKWDTAFLNSNPKKSP